MLHRGSTKYEGVRCSKFGKKSNIFVVTPNFFGRGTWRLPNLPRVIFCDGRYIIQIIKKNLTEKYYFIMEKSSSKNYFVLEKKSNFSKYEQFSGKSQI